MKTLTQVLFAALATGLLAAQGATHESRTNAVPAGAQSGTAGNECPGPAVVRIAADPSGLNLVGGLMAINFPTLGNTDFVVCLDDAADKCGITPGSPTYILLAEEPFVSYLVPGAGCEPGAPGLLMINVFDPSFHQVGPVTWVGPGMPACHTFVVPNDPSLCGVRCVGQGVFVDEFGPSGPWVLTEPLRFVIGS